MNVPPYTDRLFSRRCTHAVRARQITAALLLSLVSIFICLSSNAYAAGPDGDGNPVPVIQPEPQTGGKSLIRITDENAAVTCGPHYWFDVAGDTNIIDALGVRLLHADGTFFNERNTYVGFIGELGDTSDFTNWDPNTYDLVFCVDAVSITVGDGSKTFCANEEPIVKGGDEWELAWFMANYPPTLYALQSWDLMDCQANGLYCQARVQQAARQLAVWHLIHGFVPDPTDPTSAEAAVDEAVLAVYEALLNSIPATPPLLYAADPMQLSFEHVSASNILPGGEDQTVRVRLTKGAASSTPLSNYRVELESSLGEVAPAGAETDAQGVVTFTVSGNRGGTAILTATATVTVPQSVRYDVPNGSPTQDQAQGMTEEKAVTITATTPKTWIQTHPGMSLRKTVTAPESGVVSVGEEITFTIAVRNTGDTVLVTVPISDVYDGEYLQYVRTNLRTPDVNTVDLASLEGILVWRDITDDVGDLSVGRVVTFTVTFKALVATGSTENYAFADHVIDEHGNPVPPVSGQDSVNIGIKEPTAILLLWLYATPTDKGIRIQWHTGWEQNTWGFHIWRSESGQRSDAKRITPSLIAPQGSSNLNASYSFLDQSEGATITSSYWLEEIEMDGQRHEYGPVRPGLGGIVAPVFGWNSIFLPSVVGAQ